MQHDSLPPSTFSLPPDFYSQAADPALPALTPNPALLYAGLEALDSALLVVDPAGQVVYATAGVGVLLGRGVAGLCGQPWATLWATVGADRQPLTAEGQRTRVRRGVGLVDVRAWQRPLGADGTLLVGLEDLAAEDEREREVLRIFQDAQEQADDLFALYQITQFLNAASELDQLCSTFLRELVRITSATQACLYLQTAAGWQPQAWYGLDAVPPTQLDEAAARAWLPTAAGDAPVLTLPLLAEERAVGLAVLAHPGALGRERRFLHTLAKEMGTALLVMAGREALRRQEQKLTAIITGTTDAIIGVGPDGAVREFNPAAALLTGYGVDEALGRSCRAVLGCGPAGGCGDACPFAHVLGSGAPIPYTELVLGGPGGRRHVAASIAPLDLGAGAAPAAVAILRDVSAQKRVEQMKADFLTTVSHQLRTPLALLRGYTDTLQHLDLSPQEQRTYLVGLGETTDRLAHLVDQVLDVTRIEDGRMALEREPTRLVDLVRRAVTALPHTAYRSRIWTELAADLPLLDADPQRVEQVLINLLDNALKYSPPTGPVIIRAARAGARVQVQVLDEGMGIPAEDQALLFAKFQRASNARQRQVPGTGLGLFICRSIIEAHGGHILLASAPGAGTCVTFWLPIVAEGAADAQQRNE